MILKDEGGAVLWDFDMSNVLALRGDMGIGKTTLARHAALSWAENGGAVIVAANMTVEYADMSSAVHLSEIDDSFLEMVTYLHYQMAEMPEKKLLIVVDDVDRCSLKTLEVLMRRVNHPDNNIFWMLTSHRVLLMGARNASRNMLMGRATDDLVRDLFDVPHVARKGHALQLPLGTVLRKDSNVLVERHVPISEYLKLRERLARVTRKEPIPTPPKRFWYATAR